MGTRGPLPKRSDQRRRQNKPVTPVTKAPGTPPDEIKPLPVNGKWHATAKRWYESLAQSGQAAYYQPSDWATAYLLAESISRELKPQPIVVGKGKSAEIKMVELPPKGASLAAWLKGMTALLVTEGDRRRAALELQRPTPAGEEPADVSDLADFRARARAT